MHDALQAGLSLVGPGAHAGPGPDNVTARDACAGNQVVHLIQQEFDLLRSHANIVDIAVEFRVGRSEMVGVPPWHEIGRHAVAHDVDQAEAAARVGELQHNMGALGADDPAARATTRKAVHAVDPGSHRVKDELRVEGRLTLELMLTGDIIEADEACRIGIFNRVVAHELLEKVAMEFAQRLASGPAESLALTKAAVYKAANMDLDEGFRVEEDAKLKSLKSQDVREGIMSFVDKRKSTFQGR